MSWRVPRFLEPGGPWVWSMLGIVIGQFGLLLYGHGLYADAPRAEALKALGLLQMFVGVMFVGLPFLFEWPVDPIGAELGAAATD